MRDLTKRPDFVSNPLFPDDYQLRSIESKSVTCATLGAETAAFLQQAASSTNPAPNNYLNQSAQNYNIQNYINQNSHNLNLNHNSLTAQAQAAAAATTAVAQFTIPVLSSRPEPPAAPPPMINLNSNNLQYSPNQLLQNVEFNAYAQANLVGTGLTLAQGANFNNHGSNPQLLNSNRIKRENSSFELYGNNLVNNFKGSEVRQVTFSKSMAGYYPRNL